MKGYKLKEKILEKEQIKNIVTKLGNEIRNNYSQILNNSQVLCIIGILDACIVFIADLMRAITPKGREINIQYGSIDAASYGSGTEAQELKIGNLKVNVSGKHVLLVDTVVDTGKTFQKILQNVKRKNPLSVKTCCLIDKPARREVEIPLDWVGYTLPEDVFIVGYGLDVGGHYRNLPDIWAVQKVE